MPTKPIRKSGKVKAVQEKSVSGIVSGNFVMSNDPSGSGSGRKLDRAASSSGVAGENEMKRSCPDSEGSDRENDREGLPRVLAKSLSKRSYLNKN